MIPWMYINIILGTVPDDPAAGAQYDTHASQSVKRFTSNRGNHAWTQYKIYTVAGNFYQFSQIIS